MNRKDYVQVDWPSVTITKSRNRTFECNTLILKNQGTQNVYIDFALLTPGESITYECYPGEMNIRAYDITFTNDRQAGAEVVAIMKVYQNHKPTHS